MSALTLRARLILLFVSVLLIALLLVIFNVVYIAHLDENHMEQLPGFLQYAGLLKVQTLILVILVAFLGVIFVTLNRAVLTPLQRLKDGLRAARNGLLSQRLNMAGSDEICEIACTFNVMADNLEQSYRRLELQTSELSDRNFKLRKVNSQLEASYEQLNETEQKYHSLLRNIPDMVFVTDNEGRIIFVNDACVETLGHPKGVLMGNSIMNFVDPDKTTFSLERIEQKLKDKKSITVKFPLVKEDGTTLIAEAHFAQYCFNGIKMGLQATVRDVTSKRNMEKEIIQSNEDLAVLNSVTRSIASTLELNALSQLIVHKISCTLKFPVCMLKLTGKNGSYVDISTHAGPYFQDVDSGLKSEDLGQDLEECLGMGNEVIRMANLPKQWFLSKLNEKKTEGQKIRDLLVVPLDVAGKRKGVLAVGSYTYLRNKDIDLISSIANNVAVAMDNALLYDNTKRYFIRTIDVLIAAIEAKDKYTEGHSQRVSQYAVKIANRLGLTKEQIEEIKVAGILHDIGKIGISDSILLKPDKLTKEEYEEIKQHPSISNKILHSVGLSERTLKAIAYHHERYDGKGYPFGLKGDTITLEAQIISVADAYDAMTSNRSYREAMSKEEALNELFVNKETQFNPVIIDALFHSVGQLHEIFH